MNGRRSIPEFVLTSTPDPAFGHLAKSPTFEDVVEDQRRLKLQFPEAVIWKREPDGKMTRYDA